MYTLFHTLWRTPSLLKMVSKFLGSAPVVALPSTTRPGRHFGLNGQASKKMSSPDWLQSTTLSRSVGLIGYNKDNIVEESRFDWIRND